MPTSDLLGQSSKGERVQLRIFRPETAGWHSRAQSDDGPYSASKLGRPAYVPLYADHDGDGEADAAAWDKETGIWHIRFSSNGQISRYDVGSVLRRSKTRQTTTSLEIPVPADHDGDGKTDIALWHSGTGDWVVLLSSNGFDVNKARFFRFGEFGDIPVTADYDGDGKGDPAVFRPSDNTWYIRESSSETTTTQTFGSAGEDILVPADYDGDGKADLAVYRRGTWHVLDRSTGEVETFRLGFADSIPVPDDYDGDGVTDMAVYQEGTWYVYETKTPKFLSHVFGRAGDIPLASLRVKPSIIGLP